MRNVVCKLNGEEITLDQVDDVIDALSDPITPEQRVNIAVKRSEALFNFYSAERRAGTPALEATELMAEFAKRLDGEESKFLRELEITRKIMGRSKS